jgi:hypothetical protein
MNKSPCTNPPKTGQQAKKTQNRAGHITAKEEQEQMSHVSTLASQENKCRSKVVSKQTKVTKP